MAALVAAAAVVVLLRVWQPAEPLTAAVAAAEDPDRETASVGSTSGPGRTTGAAAGSADGPDDPKDGTPRLPDTRAEVLKAYSPYLVIVVIFSIINITAVKERLAEKPFTVLFGWPGLDVRNASGDPVSTTMFAFNWFPAAGTMLIVAGLITAVILKVGPAKMLSSYLHTYVELKSAIITVMAVLALAYVMNLSGQTVSLAAWLAGAGGAFALLSPILGWIGVAVTGSDTSSNALFGALQVTTAQKAGLDPVLMAAANSSGGVLGKMISPQNLAIAAAAVGLAGKEGDIFRKVIGWSLLLLAFMCLIVVLQATPVLSWMVP